MNKKNILMVVGAVAVVAAGVVAMCWSGSKVPPEAKTGEAIRVVRTVGAEEQKPKARRPARKPASAVKVEPGAGEAEHAKPDFELAPEDEEAMSSEFRELYEALKAAFEAEDMATVRSLVKRLREMPEWPDDVPRKVKLAALEALTWFGADCIGDALYFLADNDIEITDAALEAYEDMFMEIEIGDRAVAEMIVQLTPLVHNTEALELFFEQMNNMRNSVKVETALAIWDCGNEDALEVLKENLDDIFDDNDGDYDIESREDIVRYGEDNPDDDDDEENYGPPNSTTDDEEEDPGEIDDGDDEEDESSTTSVEQYLKENPDEDIVISVSPEDE